MSALHDMIAIKKISQAELAKRLNISQPAVSVMAKKGIINVKTARRYAKALKCNPILLLDEMDIISEYSSRY
ncbi:helix-turn-helix transcriptional regulator [Lentisphaerota bacterium WC36G]|nr:helix-turn-helix transcriptional regulator [Lentisphaerae bacterium WC36]